jgi:hypothetical protein
MNGRPILLFASVIIFISIVSCADSQSSTPARADSPIATARQLSGWFLGYSDAPAGRISWFLKLDSQTASGDIYLAPQVLALRKVSLTQDGKVSFEFGDKGEARFEGHISTGVTGKFYYSNGQTFETHLTRIDERWLSGENAAFAGVYSNVKFVPDAGDLVGEELLLIPLTSGFGGSLIFYEGVPGNIYALTDVESKNGTISFAIITHEGTQKFTAQLSSGTVILKKIANETPASNPSVLPKAKTLSEALSSQTTAR